MKEKFNIKCISNKYIVKNIEENDIDNVYNLCKNNPTYYKYCPPDVSKDSIKEDMYALPKNKTFEDKFYVGIYDSDNLIGVLDLILDYPNVDSAFIGFFMIGKEYQGNGIGTNIVTDLVEYLKNIGYIEVNLAYAKGNEESESFWLKNSFEKTGQEIEKDMYTAVKMKRKL